MYLLMGLRWQTLAPELARGEEAEASEASEAVKLPPEGDEKPHPDPVTETNVVPSGTCSVTTTFDAAWLPTFWIVQRSAVNASPGVTEDFETVAYSWAYWSFP